MASRRGAPMRALDAPDPAVRCYLFYGPDEAGSRALAARLVKALGADAERIDLEPARLKADPAILADEAAAISMFGGSRYLRVDGADDACLAAVEALLEAPAAGNPVLLIAGALRKDAKLVKRIDGDPAGQAVVSYIPEPGDAARLAIDLGRAEGLRIGEDVARRLAGFAGGDRAMLAAEVEKLALYADATTERPVELDHAMLDAIGVDAAEADLARLVQSALSGDRPMLAHELARLEAEGESGIGLLRALLRRLVMLAPLRAEVDAGASPGEVVEGAGRTVFWKERQVVAGELARWNAPRLAAAIERLSAAEREVKASGGIGELAAQVAVAALARTAARSR